MEIKSTFPDTGMNHAELQKYYIGLTAELLKKGIIRNLEISNTFKTVFIVSTGRTGTKFLAQFFSNFQSTYSRHEPYPDFLDLANDFAREEIDKKTAINEFVSKRAFIISQANQFKIEFYIESNDRLYALIPIINEALPLKKFLHIVRDGRDVVRSGMNRGYYTAKDPFDRITALDFPEDPYFDKWHEMSLFEKVCWWWQKKDSIIYENLKEEKNAMRLKIEDLKDSKKYGPHVRKMCQFLGFPASNKVLNTWDELLRKQEKSSVTGDFPHWKDWTNEQKEQFEKIAGDHMREIGYSLK